MDHDETRSVTPTPSPETFELESLSFEAQVEHLTPLIERYASRFLRRSEDIEDLRQEVLFTVYRARERYQGEARFETWVIAITRNLALNVIRRRHRRPQFELQGDVSSGHQEFPCSPQDDPYERLVARRLLKRFQAGLMALPAAQRRAVIDAMRSDATMHELASRHGRSVGTVKSRLSRGRARLKEQMASPNAPTDAAKTSQSRPQ